MLAPAEEPFFMRRQILSAMLLFERPRVEPRSGASGNCDLSGHLDVVRGRVACCRDRVNRRENHGYTTGTSARLRSVAEPRSRAPPPLRRVGARDSPASWRARSRHVRGLQRRPYPGSRCRRRSSSRWIPRAPRTAGREPRARTLPCRASLRFSPRSPPGLAPRPRRAPRATHSSSCHDAVCPVRPQNPHPETKIWSMSVS
jgi:hypothetical protein